MLTKRHVSHAKGYLELGMVAEAAAELDKILAPDRDEIEVLSLRLAILQEQENWPMLRDLARLVVAQSPEESAAWVTWAYATRRSDSISEAERILLNAEIQHPQEPTIQFNLGCYACQRGDLTAARYRVDRAIELEPSFAKMAATDPDLAALRRYEADEGR